MFHQKLRMHFWKCFLVYLILGVTSYANDERVADTIINEFFEWRISEWPEYATKLGIDTYNDRLENLTEEAFLQQKITAEKFLDRVNAVDVKNLNSEHHISLSVMKNSLQAFINGYQFRKYGMYNYQGPLDNLMYRLNKMANGMPRKSVKDYRNLLARYRLIPRQVQTMIDLANKAVSAGTTVHTSSVNATIIVLNAELKKNVTDTVFFTAFKDEVMPDSIDEPERSELKREARDMISNDIMTNLTVYRDYLQNEYYEFARPEPGVGSLPGGSEFYKACLKWHITADMTPEQVHQVGLQEVDRIWKKMEALMSKEKFEGSLKEYVNALKADPTNYFSSSDEIIKEYQKIMRAVHSKLPTVLKTITDLRVEVRPSNQNVSRYSSPTKDGSRPGIFWADVKNPEEKLKLNMAALALHEAEPGHHTQITYNWNSDIPKFRITEYLRYNGVPFNWLFQTAYGEGWALYAESLGEEMNIYTQPNSLLGRYMSEMFRATRLVVDTGIHAYGWSVEEAEEYMLNYTTSGPITVRNEVRRYIAWPGQACSYKIGEIKIRKLRELAQEKLGEGFDIREFHHEVLSIGAVPLTLLDTQINNWIDTKLQKSGGIRNPQFSLVLVPLCLLAAELLHYWTSLCSCVYDVVL